LRDLGPTAITWFSYDLPKKINNGTVSTEFTYGVDRSRITQIRKTGSTTDSTVRYIGPLLEREIVGSTVTWRHSVSARGRVVAQVNRVTTNTVQYLHRDHEQSVVEVTSSTGALVQSLAFDAWGLRRNATNWSPLASPFGGPHQTKRGYTGHEHLDTVELVHMNGRVQDPKLGLFISADPFVQAPYHSQSHNRYAYVWNNPVSMIDPSGFNCDNPKGFGEGCPAPDYDRLVCLFFSWSACNAPNYNDRNVPGADPYPGTDGNVPVPSGPRVPTTPDMPSPTGGKGGIEGNDLFEEKLRAHDEWRANYRSLDELMAGLKPGDLFFGKRPLGKTSRRTWNTITIIHVRVGKPDAENWEVLHEEVFFVDKNGVLQNIGFHENVKGDENGVVIGDPGFPGNIGYYLFGPIAHDVNIDTLQFQSAQFRSGTYALTENNCQDYCTFIRDQLEK
jgi:RHS repeat-associated protein